MLSGKEELTGGYRLANIRRAKRYLYLIEVVILVAAVIFVILAESRASLVPFYLPINSFIYFVLLMGLFLTVESFVFRAIEMRLIKSVSTKFYICKMGIRRALVAIVICVIVILLLWLPFIHTTIEDAAATKGTLANNHGHTASVYYMLFDRDPLGLTSLSHIEVAVSGSGDARAYLVSEVNFNAHKDNLTDLAAYRINTADYVANPKFTFEVSNLHFGKYYLVLDTERSTASSVQYTVKSSISPTFLDYVPLFAFLFAIVYAVWMIYLTPLKRKYAEAAIYR